MYTRNNWSEFIANMNSGNKVHIDDEIFSYFLEVLPPIHMSYVAQFADGDCQQASFGFAEGKEFVVAFWEEDGQYYCRKTTEINQSY